MGVLILVLVVLAAGVWLGFLLGFSRSMREAAKRANARSNRPLIGRLFVGSGCVCLLVAIGTTLYSWNFIRTAHRTTGTVTEMRERTDRETGSKSYAPTVVFRSPEGTEHRIEPNLHTDPPLHRVGETAPILYQPDAPDSARVDGFWYHWGLTTIAGLLGSLQLSGGLAVLHWPRIVARLGSPPNDGPSRTNRTGPSPLRRIYAPSLAMRALSFFTISAWRSGDSTFRPSASLT